MSDDLVREFLIESHENLDQLDGDLVALESNPRDRQRLDSIFRTIHTIKGTCGFFGFAKLASVSHVGESLLSLLRDGKMLLDADFPFILAAAGLLGADAGGGFPAPFSRRTACRGAVLPSRR
jgi:two-component system chemotaxis sensor kinase CheA